MLAQNCYGLIGLGLWIRTIRSANLKSKKSWVLNSLKTLKQLLENNGFIVSLASTTGSYYLEMEKELVKIANDDDEIGAVIASKIVDEVTKIEQIVFAEAMTKKIYSLPERRFNSDYLLNEPAKLFKDGIYSKFNEITQRDISSACKCLLVGQSTAAAFHILRATEAVLKSYYFHHCKQNRLKTPMWAGMVIQLRSKKTKKPPSALLDALDLIRTAYRNPTQHPEASYEIDGAQDLFGVCFDVLGKMGAEL